MAVALNEHPETSQYFMVVLCIVNYATLIDFCYQNKFQEAQSHLSDGISGIKYVKFQHQEEDGFRTDDEFWELGRDITSDLEGPLPNTAMEMADDPQDEKDSPRFTRFT